MDATMKKTTEIPHCTNSQLVAEARAIRKRREAEEEAVREPFLAGWEAEAVPEYIPADDEAPTAVIREEAQ